MDLAKVVKTFGCSPFPDETLDRVPLTAIEAESVTADAIR